MNMYPSLTNVRSSLSNEFSRLQARALRNSLWPKLKGRNTRLEVFPESAPEKSPNRRFLGEQEIPLEQIVGTLNRQDDFDDQFRPLKPSLRELWIDTRLTLETEGWSPILVHKVGTRYYVEDGHQRVSVARWLGMACIRAKVWEYPLQVKASKQCQPAPCPEAGSTTFYAEVTD